MNIPFLRHIPGLGRPTVRRVVATSHAAAPPAAAALQHLLAELPDLLLAAVLDVATGQLLATYAVEHHYQPALVAGSAVAVVRQVLAGMAGQPTEQLQEVLLTLPSQLHLLRLSPSGQQVLYLVVDAHDTNLAIARQLVQQATTQLI